MYLDPIYWIMDNSSLRFLEEEWKERKKKRKKRMKDKRENVDGKMNGDTEKQQRVNVPRCQCENQVIKEDQYSTKHKEQVEREREMNEKC